ncbi:hypothetical protein UFOVP1636_180 [uncultured Caudovirales phage]|uniref:Uncharacterized protein n=1 Tax=uncultured Caudovirales phage TaxID=2100421 RepID=A0A6J5T3K8_9CAUD|nr:hypothetical protein UFOVP1636_180 [uncultured Caudovirales phage]
MADNGAYARYLETQRKQAIVDNKAKFKALSKAEDEKVKQRGTSYGDLSTGTQVNNRANGRVLRQGASPTVGTSGKVSDPYAANRKNAGRSGYDEAGDPIDPYAANRKNAGKSGYDEAGDPIDPYAKERANAGRTGYDEAGTKINSDGTPGGSQKVDADGESSSSDSGGSPSGNPLDEYANYTYGLSLHVIKPEEYEELKPGYDPDGKVLIASGGRQGSGFSRVAGFESDFYFDNFRMTTIIGMNQRTRGSNVIDMQFTVLEPFGMTLLDKILTVADTIGAKNWNEMPFVMQIDFFANTTDDKSILISGHTKYIPIKLIECKISATSNGASYQFHGIPYNHAAFQTNSVSTPAFNEVTAKTVKEFFSSESKDKGSYALALNSYQKKLAADEAKYQEFPDIYEFKFDSAIGDAIIVYEKRNNVRSTPMANKSNPSATDKDGKRAADGGSAAQVDLEYQAIPINAGTSIIDVISQVIRNSSYMAEQVGKSGDDVIKSWRVIPEIKILKFDNFRKIYQKKFIYHVKKANYHNTKYPDAPMKMPTKISRIYNYLYTGQNQDILDFNIDFNVVFYTAMTANRDKLKKVEIDKTPKKQEEDKGTKPSPGTNKLDPKHVKTVATQADVSTSSQGANDTKNVASNDLVRSMFTDSRGDMININLKIAGDPAYIKQDDIFFKPEESKDSAGTLDKHGSFSMDGGELFVEVNFRTPTDINPSSDTYDFSNSEKTAFSGTYRVMTVDNVLERGQFTQTLSLIKVFPA